MIYWRDMDERARGVVQRQIDIGEALLELAKIAGDPGQIAALTRGLGHLYRLRVGEITGEEALMEWDETFPRVG